MGRHKSSFNVNIRPWLSARRDCSEGRFIQVGNSLLLSHKDNDGIEQNQFVKLSSSDKYLYLCMALESGGRREFQFPLSSAKKYGIKERTFRRGVNELIEAKMIQRQSGATARLPNNYEFVFDWKDIY